jgi:outer membrane protein assembly factor BamB
MQGEDAMRVKALALGVLLVLLGVVGLAAAENAAHWPRFRGPNGTGVSTAKTIPVQWTEATGVLWKAPIQGSGNSSPVVWGDRLFLHAASPDGGTRYLHCLSVIDGKVLWTKSSTGRTAKTHKKNTLASSTPATDGERVYVVFWDGEAIALHAYDLAGNPSWKRDLGSFKQISPTTHGAGNSPILHAGRLYFVNEQDESAALLCLDAKSGETLWQKKRPGFRTCYSTPFILERPNQLPELIVASTAGVASYDPANGEANWTFTWTFAGKPLRTVGSPIFVDGLILATSGDGGGDRHAIAVKAYGKGDVSKTNLVWENRKALPYVPTVLVHDGHIYAVNDMGVASCWLAKTGENVWTERLGGNVSASPILVDGKVYAITEEGEVHVFRAATKFEPLGRSQLGESVIASPAVAGERLFIRGRQHLYCIGKQTKSAATGP